jgi:hypothetical protein
MDKTVVGFSVATRSCNVYPDKCWSASLCQFCPHCSLTLRIRYGEVVPVHGLKTYDKCGGTAPLILYLGITVRYAVAQLVEALRNQPGGCGFDSRWWHWNFSLTRFFRPHYGTGVDSASNRNQYQEYILGVKATGE